MADRSWWRCAAPRQGRKSRHRITVASATRAATTKAWWLDTGPPRQEKIVSTHASPSRHIEQQHAKRRIVVGVDTRGRSVSALVWATAEAEREDTTLIIVTAARET